MGAPGPATRRYRSVQRAQQASSTRERILAAATELFVQQGYGGTTMRAIAAGAGVAVPTVELAFGTKARLLAAAVDRAIAGDDLPVPMLERPWAAAAADATDAPAVLAIAARALASSQARSAGLVVATFEAARREPELEALGAELARRRLVVARWLVDRLLACGSSARLAPAEAAETVWALIDPSTFLALTRHRGWSTGRYEAWIAATLHAVLVPAPGPVDRSQGASAPAPPTTTRPHAPGARSRSNARP